MLLQREQLTGNQSSQGIRFKESGMNEEGAANTGKWREQHTLEGGGSSKHRKEE